MRLIGWFTTIVVCDYFMILFIWWPLAPISRDTMPSGTKIMTEKASFLFFFEDLVNFRKHGFGTLILFLHFNVINLSCLMITWMLRPLRSGMVRSELKPMCSTAWAPRKAANHYSIVIPISERMSLSMYISKPNILRSCSWGWAFGKLLRTSLSSTLHFSMFT